MKKIVTFSFVALIIVGAVIATANFIVQKEKRGLANTEKNSVSLDSKLASANITLTLAEIAKHNSKESCWLLISNKVYDVTLFFGKHPGGDAALLPNCGKESTEAFATKGKSDGKSHSSEAKALLNNFYIGDLNQTIIVSPVKPSTPTINPSSIPPSSGDDSGEFEDD